MAIIQETIIGRIEILEDGQLQIREELVTKDDVTGEEVAPRQFHREVIDVEDDVSTKDQRIKDVANIIWTPQIKAARAAKRAADAAEMLDRAPPMVDET